MKECDRLDANILCSDSITIFRKPLLNFMRYLTNKVPNLHNRQRLKLLRMFRLDLSHLRIINLSITF